MILDLGEKETDLGEKEKEIHGWQWWNQRQEIKEKHHKKQQF